MKSRVLAQAPVRELLKDFVVAELYTDFHQWKKENSELLKSRFKTAALPLYVTLGPDGAERSRLAGVATTDEFIAFLKKGIASTGPP
jgi:thiol:disulfide interchange protein